MTKLDASLLNKFVQLVHFAGIEVGFRNSDRIWNTGVAIEVCVQELGSELGYRKWDGNWVTGTEIEVADSN